MTLRDIPKRKPRDYPEDFRKWAWIGETIRLHCCSKRVWGRRIETWKQRTDRGRAQTWAIMRRRFPYAFAKPYRREGK